MANCRTVQPGPQARHQQIQIPNPIELQQQDTKSLFHHEILVAGFSLYGTWCLITTLSNVVITTAQAAIRFGSQDFWCKRKAVELHLKVYKLSKAEHPLHTQSQKSSPICVCKSINQYININIYIYIHNMILIHPTSKRKSTRAPFHPLLWKQKCM